MSNNFKNTPIFIINLKRDIDKKKDMQALIKKHHLEASFIDAVDGKNLSEAEIKSVYSQSDSIKTIGRPLTKTEIGCAMSHLYIYQKMLDENIKEAIILEDDVILSDYFAQLPSLIAELPEDWQLLLLGVSVCLNLEIPAVKRNIMKIKTIHRWTINAYLDNVWGTHGYLINQAGAKTLLNITKRLYMPIDWYTGNYRYLPVYVLLPEIVKVDLSINSGIRDERNMLVEAIPNKYEYKLIKIILKHLRLFIFLRFIRRQFIKTIRIMQSIIGAYYRRYNYKKVVKKR